MAKSFMLVGCFVLCCMVAFVSSNALPEQEEESRIKRGFQDVVDRAMAARSSGSGELIRFLAFHKQ